MIPSIVLACMPGGDGRTLFIGHGTEDNSTGDAPEYVAYGISTGDTPLNHDQKWSCFDRIAQAVAEKIQDAD